MTDLSVHEAIHQLREQLREAVLENNDQDIVFTPEAIEVELAITFKTEMKAGGGIKLLALLDLTSAASGGRESQHKVKLSLSVADRSGQPIRVRSNSTPTGLPK